MLAQTASPGRHSPAYVIDRYADPRRRAILVALILDLEARLTDAALDMADKLIGGLFRRAKNTRERRFSASSREVARLMRLFGATIDTLDQADEEGSDPIAALERTVGWHTLLQARHAIEDIAGMVEADPLLAAGERHAALRRFAPMLIEALEFRASRGSAGAVKAVELLRDLNRSKRRDLPPDAPMPFRKEWRRILAAANGQERRRLYEVATMAHLRNKLRSGDVWVERSSAYRRLDSYLIPAETSAPMVAALDLPGSAEAWLAERADALDQRLRRFAAELDRLEGVRLVDGRLQVAPVRADPDPAAAALAARLDGLLPKIRITELLHDVASETGSCPPSRTFAPDVAASIRAPFSRRSWRTPPISACPAWRPRARASRATSSSGRVMPMCGTTAIAGRWRR